MPGKTLADIVEEWQTGFFLLVGAVVVGLLLAILVAPALGPFGTAMVAVAGSAAAFLALSYALYGR